MRTLMHSPQKSSSPPDLKIILVFFFQFLLYWIGSAESAGPPDSHAFSPKVLKSSRPQNHSLILFQSPRVEYLGSLCKSQSLLACIFFIFMIFFLSVSGSWLFCPVLRRGHYFFYYHKINPHDPVF